MDRLNSRTDRYKQKQNEWTRAQSWKKMITPSHSAGAQKDGKQQRLRDTEDKKEGLTCIQPKFWRRETNGGEAIFKKLVAENFPELIQDINPLIQKPSDYDAK